MQESGGTGAPEDGGLDLERDKMKLAEKMTLAGSIHAKGGSA